MKRVWLAVGTAIAPVLVLACSGSPDDSASSSGENLNWHGGLDGSAWAFDGALPSFPRVHPDGGFPFEIPDSGFPFAFPDGAPFELPDSGFGDLPPWFKWPDGKFHVEPCDGGFKFALPTGGFACPGRGGGFTFEGRDGGFMPPPFELPDSGFVRPEFPDAGLPHAEPPAFGGKRP